ncbi:MAG: LTA synthase family protein [Alistipes senegalensis]|nr:LTA synthase family protein [Oxalobacter formigenes]MCM1281535.1 LTA synthase family protein [Alistipes senegalensis]
MIVLAESLENSFSDSRIGSSLIPNLESFKKQSRHNLNQIQVHGTGWTIGAMTAWHFGVPLKLPVDGNNYSTKFGHTTFLPHATSIFDILAENGYEQVLLLGSKKAYSGKDNLYKHGNFRILDKAYWKKAGYDIDKFKGTDWGYNDAFLFARATEMYQELSLKGKPFVLVIETVDTHFPDGFCPEEEKVYYDIRDAIVKTDRELGKFLAENFARKTDDTVVAVLGDHLFMGNPVFLSPVRERTIFNAFAGDVPSFGKRKHSEKVSALDMAPTLLEAAGAKWGSSRFGLGVSLFSDDPSLVSLYGEQELNRLLAQYSAFYEALY